jgi:hypothetical protein
MASIATMFYLLVWVGSRLLDKMTPYSPRVEVHAKHESQMACPLAPMSLVSIMAFHSSLGRQWVSPFVPATFYFGEKFLHLKSLGILKICLACLPKKFE